MTHSIPDACAVALSSELGTVAGHRRLQVRPDAGRRRAGRRVAPRRSSAPRGSCCCAATRRTPTAPASRRRSRSSARTWRRSSRAPPGRIIVTSFASNIHRVQQVVDAAAALDRKVALVGRSMRKNVGIGGSLGHIEIPDGPDLSRTRSRTSPTTGWSSSRPAPRASRCRRCAGWPTATIRRSSCTAATPSSSRRRRCPATSAPSTTRSTGSTTSAAR